MSIPERRKFHELRLKPNPQEFENGGFTLKTHQIFSVHNTPEKCENATITGHFAFVFEEGSGREISYYRDFIVEKLHFQNVFRPH